ncbi:hypothetical protein CHMI_03246 [Cellulomonas hominis]|nr:hypothetical protein CHMI_03246 [Cellulomonas hominis]
MRVARRAVRCTVPRGAAGGRRGGRVATGPTGPTGPAAHRCGDRPPGTSRREGGGVRRLQVVRRQQPDLVERGRGPQVGQHRLARAALGGPRPDQQRPRPLAVGVAVERPLGRLGRSCRVRGEQCPGQRLVRASSCGLQPLGLGLDLRQVRLRAERRPAPERERVRQHVGGRTPGEAVPGVHRLPHRPVEPVGVEVLRVQPVPAGDGPQVRADQRTHARRVAVQGVLRTRRRTVRPERDDEALARDQCPAVRQQDRQQGALPRTADGFAPVSGHELHGTQDPVPHGLMVGARRPPAAGGDGSGWQGSARAGRAGLAGRR